MANELQVTYDFYPKGAFLDTKTSSLLLSAKSSTYLKPESWIKLISKILKFFLFFIFFKIFLGWGWVRGKVVVYQIVRLDTHYLRTEFQDDRFDIK